MRALLVPATLVLLLLAGCSSPSSDSSEPPVTPIETPDTGTTAPVAPEPAADPVIQEEDLTWLVSVLPCGDTSQAPEAFRDAHRPELAGVAYAQFAVDPATRGGNYSVAFVVPQGTAAAQIVFWNGSVGPDGEIVGRMAQLLPDSAGITLEGVVPVDADLATVATCGAPGGAAHYLGQGVPALLVV